MAKVCHVITHLDAQHKNRLIRLFVCSFFNFLDFLVLAVNMPSVVYLTFPVVVMINLQFKDCMLAFHSIRTAQLHYYKWVAVGLVTVFFFINNPILSS